MTCARCGHENPAGQKFCGECGRPLGAGGASPATPRFRSPESYTPKHIAERILTSKAALEGERKQVTVLFADLKGSMELLADRDPEEARKLLDPVLERMMAAVHRYDGTVNQVMGDGIMALFGAPLAHEDHAVRACYAALAELYADAGYPDEGRRILADITPADRQAFCGAEVYRLEGDLLLRAARPAVEDAERALCAAIDLARARASKSLELRATVSLARLWQAQGRRDDARRAVAGVYGWFVEGFDTADLRAATTLLEELSAPAARPHASA
jgi:hypothetical protein